MPHLDADDDKELEKRMNRKMKIGAWEVVPAESAAGSSTFVPFLFTIRGFNSKALKFSLLKQVSFCSLRGTVRE
ncbi:unnamed protein product [Sphenostylis stenocarpa]|uniref:Uncharacterized protein n=1 Tax=Sphenostylis stenocarpa TaxID=92480 RepID=A0AA86SIQ7_9FABA|nr:unnamed protein product [Sphenostylis stenocarpa]